MAQFYYELFDYLVNDDSPLAANELNSAIIDELTKGLITPKVPHIDYYVIAGTKTYPLTKKLSKISGDLFDGIKNDGVVSIKSAQHIGNDYHNKICENYWEFNLSHSETIDEERPRKVVTSLIAEEKDYELGNSEYYELDIEECNSDDIYVIIGEKTEFRPVYELYCGNCGDKYCSSTEDPLDCPEDCLNISSNMTLWIIISFIIILLIIFPGRIIPKKLSSIRRKKQILYQTDILKAYIFKNYHINTKTGYTTEQLKQELSNEGWHLEIINQLIYKLNIAYTKKYGNITLRFLKIMPVEENKKEFEYFGTSN